MFIFFNDGFGFPAQVGKHRRADDQADVLKERKVKKQQGQPENNTGESEQESQ